MEGGGRAGTGCAVAKLRTVPVDSFRRDCAFGAVDIRRVQLAQMYGAFESCLGRCMMRKCCMLCDAAVSNFWMTKTKTRVCEHRPRSLLQQRVVDKDAFHVQHTGNAKTSYMCNSVHLSRSGRDIVSGLSHPKADRRTEPTLLSSHPGQESHMFFIRSRFRMLNLI